MESLTIGKVAGLAGVGVETIRFYEREGLIDEPPRRASGYRQYPMNTADRVRFIKSAKELGFTLKEIKELLSSKRLRDIDNPRYTNQKFLSMFNTHLEWERNRQ